MIGTVLALGGGGFSTLDEASDIDDHLLDLTGKNDPKVGGGSTATSSQWRLHGLPDIPRRGV
jgi:hypothetical protein